MKKATFFLAAFFYAAAINAGGETITLDLTKSTTPLEFNTNNGSWTETYDDDVESINSQVFSFVHGSIADWNTWWGFTASNHADNARPANTLIQQWSNMAKGGIVLDENGEVMLDKFGAPVVSAEVPYLVAFYGWMVSERPVDMAFTDGKCYEAVSVYVNLNSYAYYSMEYGDSFARAFTNGDKLSLTIHGVAPDETEKTVDVDFASYTNGDLTINRGWKYVDLSTLGVVNELYFTMESTDSGDYGMNTPAYFCLDKLCVKEVELTSVDNIMRDGHVDISYDRQSNTVTLGGSDFAIIYDVAGSQLMTIDGTEANVSALPAGVYIVKSGNSSYKFVK